MTERRIPVTPVPPPEKERPRTPFSEQGCQKCGATFRWERIDPDRPNAPLTLRVLKGSDRCDCGYGRPRGERKR
ncbi:hypothetical protein ACM64Y_16705 [Novispirillum sp. DQ9]|uniref:hypothetical protein n=1 Tax=Novispirillum sp. DQ9 TaxID=3398612 RepID=UPI003C7EB97F